MSRIVYRSFPFVFTAVVAASCSFSFSSGSAGTGDSRACKLFSEIALDIESGDLAAPGLAGSVEQIRAEARSADEDDVASAADELLGVVRSGDRSTLYTSLGDMEGACGPYGY